MYDDVIYISCQNIRAEALKILLKFAYIVIEIFYFLFRIQSYIIHSIQQPISLPLAFPFPQDQLTGSHFSAEKCKDENLHHPLQMLVGLHFCFKGSLWIVLLTKSEGSKWAGTSCAPYESSKH